MQPSEAGEKHSRDSRGRRIGPLKPSSYASWIAKLAKLVGPGLPDALSYFSKADFGLAENP